MLITVNFSLFLKEPEEVNADDEVEDTCDNKEGDLGAVEEQRSVILHLLSQLKLGMDLTRVSNEMNWLWRSFGQDHTCDCSCCQGFLFFIIIFLVSWSAFLSFIKSVMIFLGSRKSHGKWKPIVFLFPVQNKRCPLVYRTGKPKEKGIIPPKQERH